MVVNKILGSHNHRYILFFLFGIKTTSKHLTFYLDVIIYIVKDIKKSELIKP